MAFQDLFQTLAPKPGFQFLKAKPPHATYFERWQLLAAGHGDDDPLGGANHRGHLFRVQYFLPSWRVVYVARRW